MNIYVTGTNIISSLGFTTAENMVNVLAGNSGIKYIDNSHYTNELVPLALVDDTRLKTETTKIKNASNYTRLEQLMILSAQDAIAKADIDAANSRTLFVVSTTKGNVELLDEREKDTFPTQRVYLWKMAEVVAHYFQNKNTPIVVSNACISGVLAIEIAARFIRSQQFDNAIVIGADMLTPFVVSGFQSFKSLSVEPCKPFDVNRDGLSLGEACATVVLSAKAKDLVAGTRVVVAGGASSNDANHISGPSRTGDGLFLSIDNALKAANLQPSDIECINAHGTATLFNDDMESKAINLAGMQNIPTNSLKGYFGHTLGAAGTVESIVSIHAMIQGKLVKTLGCITPGVAEKINIIEQNRDAKIKHLLKMSSGFGGCNTAVIFSTI